MPKSTTVTRLSAVAAMAALALSGLLVGCSGDDSSKDPSTDKKDSTEEPPAPDVEPAGKIVKIAAGDDHALALDENGDVFAWGSNAFGQLGLDSEGSDDWLDVPTRISGLPGALEDRPEIVDIDANDTNSIAVAKDGAVYMWGYTGDQLFGLPKGTEEVDGVEVQAYYQTHPIRITGLADTALADSPKIVQASVGTENVLLLDEDGAVYSWGYNGGGEVGNGRAVGDAPGGCESDLRCEVPIKITGLAGGGFADSPKIVQVSAGNTVLAAVDEAGRLYTWGNDFYGQIGGSDSAEEEEWMPRVIETGALAGVKVTAAVVPEDTVLALGDSGRVYGLGSADGGRLGFPPNAGVETEIGGGLCDTNERCYRPLAIPGLEDVEVVSLAKGGWSVVAADGALYAWSRDQTPAKVTVFDGGSTGEPKIVQSARSSNAVYYALDDQGTVYAKGNGELGELGAGSTKELKEFTAIAFP